nr:hypothetical protein [Tanacetum cinerariifolium]
MVAPIIPASVEENLGDPIDIRVDIIHPEPVAAVSFPAAAVVRTQAQHREAIGGIQDHLLGVLIQEELTALRFRVDIAEAENTSLHARIKTTEEIEMITRHCKSEHLIVKFHKHVDMIHGRVRASKPKTMQDAIGVATKLRNKKISTLVECQTKNKKRLDNTSKKNQNQQQPNKRQNTGRAYTARHGEKKHYSGSKPLCLKCNYHHDGPCAPKCHQCNRFGHLARDCRSSTNANTTNIQKGTRASQKATCYECGNQGHYKRECPDRKNQNHKNQIKSTKARGVVHAFGGGETKQDFNNIEDEIEV